MFEYLHDHSVKNMMCHPEQDHQHKFRLHRLTGSLSRKNFIYINGRKINHPNRTKRFHVYRIGNIDPSVLRWIEETPLWRVDQWFKLDDLINSTTQIAIAYTSTGVVLPPHLCQYMFTNNRDLLVAIEDDYTLERVRLTEDKIYLKTYKNAYYSKPDPGIKTGVASKSTYCHSVKVVDTDTKFDAQVKYLEYKEKPGAVMAFVNGLLVDVISADILKNGDYVYFYYDASIDRVVNLELNELDTFISNMDSMYKYILHYPGDSDRIDFKDDLELFIIRPYVGTTSIYKIRGIYYHTNSRNSIRNLTHKDYSVPVEYVEYSSNKLKEMLSDNDLAIQNFKFRIYIRKSGYNRQHVYESSRLHELYRLESTDVKRALSGLDANVPFWHADQLEQSAYMRIVSSRYDHISKNDIEESLGYNAISKLLGDTMQATKLRSNMSYAKLMPQHYRSASVYEYSEDGVLLNVVDHLEGSDYYSRNTNVTHIEAITGLGSINTGTEISNASVKLPDNPHDNYRIYKGDLVGPLRINDWIDITDTDQWEIIDGRAKLKMPDDEEIVIMIVSDTKHYRQNIKLKSDEGNYYIRLREKVKLNDSIVDIDMPGPSGELDVFLNGRSLIPEVDYSYMHPILILNNKEYLESNDDSYSEQNIHVRFTGFCDAQFKMRDADDVGYVVHGRLSRNRRYDTRNDRVLKVIVAGRCFPVSKLKFDEDHIAEYDTTHVLNGSPYMVRDIVVPYKDYVQNRDTYQMRSDAIVKDNYIENYLSLKFPHKPITEPMAIQRRYRLYSPFLNSIVYRLLQNKITDQMLNVNLSSVVLDQLVKESKYLLQHDPCFFARVDDRFTIVEPHMFNKPITISLYKYRFLLKVVEIYLDNKIDLTTQVNYSI